MKEIIKSQSGATALIAAIVTAAVILSISLSVMVISLNNKSSMLSFKDSIRTFYAAESGVEESLMQLRKQPNNLIFSDISVDNINVSSQFVESGGCAGGGVCNSNIQSTASTTEATRKVRYTCTQEISNCAWDELVP
ncbi:hypothetical protein HOB10_05010 [Candidatus Parcubacteria bacterium]|jgi:hypothetical protein|nr:hypothetical protein [Candidatus Parcubacteria bacterium]